MKEIILLFVFAFVITMNGCGDKKEVSGDKDAPPSKDNKTELKDPSSNTKQEEANKTGEANTDPSKQDADKSNELGMTPGMPSNFPPDIPQPKNSKVIGSLTSTEGTMVTFESKDKVQEIITYYKEEMTKNGYAVSEDGELITPDKGGLINWKKGTKEVQLVLGYDKDKNLSSLVITYK
ncbi:MAG: hypothetical protein ABI528_08600 [bacterium]